jgi:hypothetical protein
VGNINFAGVANMKIGILIGRSILVEVFRDGKLLAETTFSEMRDRVKL